MQLLHLVQRHALRDIDSTPRRQWRFGVRFLLAAPNRTMIPRQLVPVAPCLETRVVLVVLSLESGAVEDSTAHRSRLELALFGASTVHGCWSAGFWSSPTHCGWWMAAKTLLTCYDRRRTLYRRAARGPSLTMLTCRGRLAVMHISSSCSLLSWHE
eukprot:4225615-Prymnesium_polylepis.1